jgi:hypothetical protein
MKMNGTSFALSYSLQVSQVGSAPRRLRIEAPPDGTEAQTLHTKKLLSETCHGYLFIYF